MTATERFNAKVRKVAGGCWLWSAYVNADGYGEFWFEGRRWLAHRWSYTRWASPIPAGLQIDHLCRNRACVNPAHLEPVTQQENQRRGNGYAARNARKTHCAKGHPFDETNTVVVVEATGTRRRCRSCTAAIREGVNARRRQSRRLT